MTFAFARFDLRSWLPRTQTLLPLLVVLIAGVMLPVPGMAIMAAAFVASLTVSAPFIGDEKGRLDTLYGVMPIPRGAVVRGRALAVLVYALVAAVLATVVTVVMATIRGDELATDIIVIMLAIGFAFLGLSLSMQLPVLFRIGYARGRLMSFAPALVVAGLAWLAQATGLLEPMQEAASDVPFGVGIGVCVAIGVIGIVVAVVLATASYRTREL